MSGPKVLKPRFFIRLLVGNIFCYHNGNKIRKNKKNIPLHNEKLCRATYLETYC